MIKVIVVDDEDIIREGISSFIDWRALGMELSGQASNGLEAARLIQAAGPDIIITDVKMPKMNGIQLLAVAKEKNPDCLVIMVSSYDQFEYAQQSLNLGAFAYLLKPIDTEKLIALLKEGGEKIKKKSSQQQLLDNYRGVLEQAQSDILDNKLKVLVFGGEVDEFTCGERKYLENIPEFSIITVYAGEPLFREEIFIKEMEEKLNLWKSKQKNKEIKTFQNQNRMNIFSVFHYGKEELELKKLSLIFSQYYKEIAVGVSENADTFTALSRIYRQSLEAVEYRFFTKQPVIFFRDIKKVVCPSLENTEDWRKFLKKSLSGKGVNGSKTIDDSQKFAASLLEYIYMEKPSGLMLKTIASSVIMEILHSLREAGGKPEDLFLSVTDTIDGVLNEKNPDFMVDGLKNILDRTAEYIRRLEEFRISPVVLKARKYIEENYRNPGLRLDEVAEYVHINPSYFSTIFSRELKISFGDYLTKVRMEEAVRLLTNTPLKIYEIAERAGYQNVPWFTVAFKRYTGKKPGDFRRLGERHREADI
ncbi:MAG: response regulator [Lachnoclostridium edouardi]|uniref:response regulator transcription factor n=1 Tax=Lachnoclostridium edouardi TaxID=1926283 RepID=UPI0026DC8351|nr:response regulator [Lachnoclostridium edouardi]MDO4277354.1 response regulator [Lachnoclostridium edouardi]